VIFSDYSENDRIVNYTEDLLKFLPDLLGESSVCVNADGTVMGKPNSALPHSLALLSLPTAQLP